MREETKPSVLIATPMYGGQCTMQFIESINLLNDYLGQQQIPTATYFIANESLITRGRNTCATLALEKKFDKLLFIDADIGFTPHDFARLYYSDKKIVGGLYPHKTLPIKLNFNHIRNGTLEDIPFEEYRKRANEAGEVEVEHIATGFLMIDCSVLRQLQSSTPSYTSTHMNGVPMKFYDFFTAGAKDGKYLSEDWSFCEQARAKGISVWANVDTILTHTGTYTFRFPHETL